MRVTRASDPPFVDHSTIPRVDITQMNTRARISKSICAKHSPHRHFPERHLRCSSSFFVTEQSQSGFKVTLFAFCFFNNLSLSNQAVSDLHFYTHTHNRPWECEGLNFESPRYRPLECEGLNFVSGFCIQFVSKLIIFLPDLDQPIFTCPRA